MARFGIPQVVENFIILLGLEESYERHIGPTSKEFVEAFDVGMIRKSDGKRDDIALPASDVAGVALAGVLELLKKIEILEK